MHRTGTMQPETRQRPLQRTLAALGAAGLVAAGPLGATLVVGRTGPLPSARWLLAAAASWLLVAALAWTADRRPRPAGHRLALPLGALAPLAALAPLLLALYLDDQSYHRLATGRTTVPWEIAGYAAVLVVAGARWPHWPAARRATVPAAGDPPGARAGGLDPALGWVLLALLLMVGANDLVLGPLRGARPEAVALLLANLWCLGAAAAVAGRVSGLGPLGAGAALLAWSSFGPLQSGLGLRPGGALVLLGVAALGLMQRGGRAGAAGAALLGALAGFVPPAAAALLLLAASGRVQQALVGTAAGALVLLLRTSALGVAGPAGPPAAPLHWSLAGAIRGTAHLDNVALGGFHARLFGGPSDLTAAGPGAATAAVLALNLGALAAGCLLAAWVARGAGRGAAPPDGREQRSVLLAALGVVLGLVLAGTTPRDQLVVVAACLVPVADRRLWRHLSRRQASTTGGLALAGYLLAGTSAVEFARAAAGLLSAWPPLASLPALGLVLLGAALTLALQALPHGAADGPDGAGAVPLEGPEAGTARRV